MRTVLSFWACSGLALAASAPDAKGDEPGAPHPKVEPARELKACAPMVPGGFLKIPDGRSHRFLGKVSSNTMICRGGEKNLQFRMTPRVDRSQSRGTGDMSSLPTGLTRKGPMLRGVAWALMDLEFQPVELIKFNLFADNGTWRSYNTGVNGTGCPAIKTWPEMRLPEDNPNYPAEYYSLDRVQQPNAKTDPALGK
jgi:hypothetical protein